MAFSDSAAGGEYASMRPRHKAAENDRMVRYLSDVWPDASMRPRHKAAENRMLALDGAGFVIPLQ